MNKPNLIVGIKGVAKFLNCSTTRAHVYMTGKQAILPEPYHKNSGKSHEYRCYIEEQLLPVKHLLSLSGKLEVVKAALTYINEIKETKLQLNEAQAKVEKLKEEIEKLKIPISEEMEIENPLEMIERQEKVGEVIENETPTLTLNN